MSTPERVTRAITIRLPWAAAIVYGPKRVENRGRRIADRHRGALVGIHVASAIDTGAMLDARVTDWLGCPPREVGARIGELASVEHRTRPEMQQLRSQIIAVARIAGCHPATSSGAYNTCCWPWGDREYLTPDQPAWHVELMTLVTLRTPVGPMRGALPVPWTLPPEAADRATAEYLASRPW